MHANRRIHSREAVSPVRIEGIRATRARENTYGTLVEYVVFEDLLAKEEHPACAERTKLVSPAILRDVIAGILGLDEDTVTALANSEGLNGIRRTGNLLESKLQGLINTAIDETARSGEFKNHLLGKIEDVTSSPQPVKRIQRTCWIINISSLR